MVLEQDNVITNSWSDSYIIPKIFCTRQRFYTIGYPEEEFAVSQKHVNMNLTIWAEVKQSVFELPIKIEEKSMFDETGNKWNGCRIMPPVRFSRSSMNMKFSLL